MRLGSEHDGGYVVVDDFSSKDYILSFGIADNVDFERVISQQVTGIDMYDFSIDHPPTHVDKARFFKEKITSDSSHVLTRVDEHDDLILKIDIEGSEWEFFEAISEEDINKFRQIILEIHWMIQTHQINVPECRIDIIEKINKTHQIVALHPNNWAKTVDIDGTIVPTVLELTLLRRSDYTFVEGTPPSNLFTKNNPDFPDIENYL